MIVDMRELFSRARLTKYVIHFKKDFFAYAEHISQRQSLIYNRRQLSLRNLSMANNK